MVFKAVIFDFDGVLVDSMALHLTAWEKASKIILKVNLHDSAQLIGKSTKTIAKLLTSKCNKPELFKKLIEFKQNSLRDTDKIVPLLPGTIESFEILKKNKIPFGICSNAPKNFILNTLKSHHLECPLVNGIESTSTPKPSPIPYLKTAKDLNITTNDFKNIIVFEDSLHGMKAAINAGMKGIGITTQHSGGELRYIGAMNAYPSILDAIKDGLLDFS